ncbi:MAG TPA: phosphatase PAP2 family protein, partial [Candidatus Saccharimonadales bacterium]|nr:phosphatase PAP2 family protein [Candidatus Saccharimonadales bacterium]
YSFMPAMDRTITGGMPTAMLQKLLWHGHVVWYDYFFYAFYAAHYVLIVFLAWMVYKFRKDGFEYFYSVYLLATLSAFVFFVLYPTAPPWMASSDGYIPHITRVSQAVFNSLGVHNFAGLYNRYSPDAAGAFPSLHSAYASLFSIFTFRFFGKRWGTLSLIYPLTIFFAVIYLGEHYLTDVIAGVALSFSCYWAVPFLLKKGRLVYEQVLVRLKLIMNERKW